MGSSLSSPQGSLSSFPELSKLTVDELKELDENPVALQLFLRNLRLPESHPETRKEFQTLRLVDDALSEMRCQIDSAVAERRHLVDDVEQKRASLLASLDRFHSSREALTSTTTAIKQHRERYSAQNLCELMQQSSLVDEEKSEKCADEFLAGNSNVEQFVADYVKIRSDHHKKKVAVEKVKRNRKC